MDSVTIVMATKDRRDRALTTLDRLQRLPEQPPIIVVDNGSRDGTPGAIRRRYADVTVIEAGRNLGAAARNYGVTRAQTPYIAFSDDDSWWSSGSLEVAAGLLDAYPTLALIAARILVGRDGHVDRTCAVMARSPLRHRDERNPGTAILGFVACGAIVRRSAFLEVGGFCAKFGVGGEEHLLSVDLAAAGWDLAYSHGVVAHHEPSPHRNVRRRRRAITRNAVLSAWMRLSVPGAIRTTKRLIDVSDLPTLAGLGEAVLALPWVLRNRRVVPARLEASIETIARPVL
jgi:N-acetylglucosaminyl-diphospho-decaprenol L-rhamnosyltransferase